VLSSPDAFVILKIRIEGVCAIEVAQSEFSHSYSSSASRGTPERRKKRHGGIQTLSIWHATGRSYFCRKRRPRGQP